MTTPITANDPTLSYLLGVAIAIVGVLLKMVYSNLKEKMEDQQRLFELKMAKIEVMFDKKVEKEICQTCSQKTVRLESLIERKVDSQQCVVCEQRVDRIEGSTNRLFDKIFATVDLQGGELHEVFTKLQVGLNEMSNRVIGLTSKHDDDIKLLREDIRSNRDDIKDVRDSDLNRSRDGDFERKRSNDR